MLSLNGEEIFEIDKMCRTCLNIFSNMTPLFGSSLDDMLRSVAQIQVSKNDGLPEMLCFQCVLHVSRSFRFLEQCRNSDAKLRSIIRRNSIDKTPDTNKMRDLPSFPYKNLTNDDPRMLNINDGNNYLDANHFEETDHNVATDVDEPCQTMFQPLKQKSESIEAHKSNFDSCSSQNMILGPTCKTNQLKCGICNKEFCKDKQLKRHAKIHDTIKSYNCNQCKMGFSEHSNLIKHLRKHTGELRNTNGKTHLCSICGKSFKWATSLSKHMNFHTKKNILQCPSCSKTYVERSTLEIHIRSHTGERPFTCSICSKNFIQSCSLKMHMAIHTGEKPFKCLVCSKAFAQKGYLNVHMRTHSGEKPFRCKECGKRFSAKAALTVHSRVHTGERPFKCNMGICEKAFSRLESVMIHRRTHTGEKPHTCEVCSRSFTTLGQLKVHKRTHTGKRPYVCSVCSKTFIVSANLKQHLQTHTEDSEQLSTSNSKN